MIRATSQTRSGAASVSDKRDAPAPVTYPIRLNRYLAACGLAARRKADGLIASGRVTVNGSTEAAVGRVLEGPCDVRVDGEPVCLSRPAYLVMNKPRGVLSAASDTRGETVLDLLPPFYRQLRVFPVGRLDKESEGLLILTNDGLFAQDLMHPSKGVRRTYTVYLRYSLGEKEMMEWQRGVIINEKLAKPLEVSREGSDADGRRFKVVLGEGFKREIRLMVRALGNRVARLVRVGIGEMVLGSLPSGAFNEFSREEICKMLTKGGEV